MRTRWLLTAALAWTLAATSLHAQSGTATGTLTVNGRSDQMKYAYAYVDSSGKSGIDIVMIMSDQALPKAVIVHDDQLRELSDKGKFNGVRIVIHEDGRVMSAAPFSKALTGYVSTALYADWSSKQFGPGGIDARIKTPAGGADAFGQKWSYEIAFEIPSADIGKGGGDRH